jgi:hypothetical protein
LTLVVLEISLARSIFAIPKSTTLTAPDVAVDHRRVLPERIDERVRVLQRAAAVADHHRGEPDRDERVPLGGHAEDLRDILAGDVLHREVELVVLDAEIEHLGDVRVRQRRADPRLLEEHPHEALVLPEVRQDPLQRDELAELPRPGGEREEDLGHPTDRQALHDRVAADHPSIFEAGERHGTQS